MSDVLLKQAKTFGRKAFVTHIDGKELLGEGYETTIWVQRDIDKILEDAEKEIAEVAVISEAIKDENRKLLETKQDLEQQIQKLEEENQRLDKLVGAWMLQSHLYEEEKKEVVT